MSGNTPAQVTGLAAPGKGAAAEGFLQSAQAIRVLPAQGKHAASIHSELMGRIQSHLEGNMPSNRLPSLEALVVTHCDDSKVVEWQCSEQALTFKTSERYVYLVCATAGQVDLSVKSNGRLSPATLLQNGSTALVKSGLTISMTSAAASKVSVLMITLSRLKSAALDYGVIWKGADESISIQSEPALMGLLSEMAEPDIDCFSEQIRLHRLKTCEALILRNWRTDSRSLISAKPVADSVADGFRRLVMSAITEDVELEDLADQLGVSSRTLYQRTRRFFGLSPALLIRHLKIEAVYEVLRHEADMTCVTRVAIEHGFTNLGRFAQHYRQHLGELPSETLGRHRKGRVIA